MEQQALRRLAKKLQSSDNPRQAEYDKYNKARNKNKKTEEETNGMTPQEVLPEQTPQEIPTEQNLLERVWEVD